MEALFKCKNISYKLAFQEDSGSYWRRVKSLVSGWLGKTEVIVGQTTWCGLAPQ